MKKVVSVLAVGAVILTTMGICMANDSDAWKENLGTVDLDAMTVTGSGIEIDGNTVKISKGGDFTVTGTLEDGMIYVNSEEKVKLRLSGASITNSTGPAIYFDNVEEGLITITEGTENYLTDGTEYAVEDADAALFSNDDLEIKGKGKLVIDGNYKHGVASDDDLLIENGEIVITSYEHGIKANNTVQITGGELEITAETGKGIKGEEAVVIDDGVINVVSEENEGIESKGTLTINGGEINITATEDGMNTGFPDTETAVATENGKMPERGNSPVMGGRPAMGENGEMPEMPAMPENGEMPEGTQMPENGGMPANRGGMGGGRPPMGGMPENGERSERPAMPENGEMPMMPENGERPEMPSMPENGERPTMGGGGRGGMGGGMDMVDAETAAAHAITINGGDIYINAGGDGIDSNGNLTITGGTLVIDGPENNGNGPLDAQGTMSITGGKISILSSAGMLQLSGNGQNIIKVIFDEKGETGNGIVLKNSDGDEIAEHIAVKSYSAFIYSSEELAEGEEYSIYVNGELYKTLTLEAGTTSSGNGGMPGMDGRGGMGGSRNNRNNRDRIKVSVDGADVMFDTDPVIKNDTTLVGFRAILEMLGAEVTWDEATRTVTAEKDGIVIKLTIGSTKAVVDGEEKTLLAAPEIINGSTMIPVRFISENLNMDVEWDEAARHIKVNGRR